MAQFSSAEEELQSLHRLDETSNQLVDSLEGMLDRFKVMNEGAKGTYAPLRVAAPLNEALHHCASLTPLPYPCTVPLLDRLRAFPRTFHAPAASAKVMGDWDNVIDLMGTKDEPGGFVAVASR